MEAAFKKINMYLVFMFTNKETGAVNWINWYPLRKWQDHASNSGLSDKREKAGKIKLVQINQNFKF